MKKRQPKCAPEGILGVHDRVWDCVKAFCVLASLEACLASWAAWRASRLGSSGQGRAAKAPTRLLLWQGRCIHHCWINLPRHKPDRQIDQWPELCCASYLLHPWSDPPA